MNQLLEQFESLPEQNVKAFNDLFKNSPLVGLRDDLEVTIGPLSPMGRKIFVDGRIFYSELVSKVAESCKNANLRKIKKEKINVTKKEKKVAKVKAFDLVIEEEMKLSGNAYKMLAVLRLNKVITNVNRLGKALKISPKTTRTAIAELQKFNYIKVEIDGNVSKITLAENNNL